MIRVRVADPDRTPHGIAEARAELARLTDDPTPTFLGWSRRRAVALGLAAATVGTALALAIPTRCVVVEHGPTGPEADVTLGHTVEQCADGHYRTTTWRIATGDVVYVEKHDGHVDPADRADLAERVAAIRDGRAGGRF